MDINLFDNRQEFVKESLKPRLSFDRQVLKRFALAIIQTFYLYRTASLEFLKPGIFHSALISVEPA